MYLMETGARNDCAGEGQQQFKRLIDTLKPVSFSHERVASQPLSSEDISTEAEEYALLEAVIGKRLVKTQKTLCVLQHSDL
jgi:hypothetical protein